MNILGVSAFYHDSAACLVQDGEMLRRHKKSGLQERSTTSGDHGSGMSTDLFIDHAGRASSRSPHATLVLRGDLCVPGAERRDTRAWREQRDGQDPAPVDRWDRCLI